MTVSVGAGLGEPLRQGCDGSHRQVDRLLIRTAAGQAGIGNTDGRITAMHPIVTGGASPKRGHAVVTDTSLADLHDRQLQTHSPKRARR